MSDMLLVIESMGTSGSMKNWLIVIAFIGWMLLGIIDLRPNGGFLRLSNDMFTNVGFY